MRYRDASFAAGATGLGQVNFDEAAVASGELGERVEALDHARALRPATAHTRGIGDDGDFAARQRRGTGGAQRRVEFRRVSEVARGNILDARGGGQAIEREPDATGVKVGADLFVLRRIETVCGEQFPQASAGSGAGRGG